MPVVRPHRWTTADVDRLIDERDGLSPRYELVDGELLVTPAPTGRHQRIVLRLAFLLQPYLTLHNLGEVRITKRRAFQKAPVPEYWIVDGDAGAFEVWHPTDDRGALVDELIIWRPAGAKEPFELDVGGFFAAVADNAPLP